jgi:hypothetical protein
MCAWLTVYEPAPCGMACWPAGCAGVAFRAAAALKGTGFADRPCCLHGRTTNGFLLFLFLVITAAADDIPCAKSLIPATPPPGPKPLRASGRHSKAADHQLPHRNRDQCGSAVGPSCERLARPIAGAAVGAARHVTTCATASASWSLGLIARVFRWVIGARVTGRRQLWRCLDVRFGPKAADRGLARWSRC